MRANGVSTQPYSVVAMPAKSSDPEHTHCIAIAHPKTLRIFHLR